MMPNGLSSEIKKLLSIRDLRQNSAQKYYELQVALQKVAVEKKEAQEKLIKGLETTKMNMQVAFETHLVQHVTSMEQVHDFQADQEKQRQDIVSANKQLSLLQIEIENLEKAVEQAYLDYMASIKAKQKIETVLKDEKQKSTLEASKDEDKKLEEIAEVLAVR